MVAGACDKKQRLWIHDARARNVEWPGPIGRLPNPQRFAQCGSPPRCPACLINGQRPQAAQRRAAEGHNQQQRAKAGSRPRAPVEDDLHHGHGFRYDDHRGAPAGAGHAHAVDPFVRSSVWAPMVSPSRSPPCVRHPREPLAGSANACNSSGPFSSADGKPVRRAPRHPRGLPPPPPLHVAFHLPTYPRGGTVRARRKHTPNGLVPVRTRRSERGTTHRSAPMAHNPTTPDAGPLWVTSRT